MSNSSYDIVPGSLLSEANLSRVGLAEAFLSADHIVLVDTSMSMAAKDSTEGRSRFDVACSELKKFQAKQRGKIAVFSFSDECIFNPGGMPIYLAGGTDLWGAMQYVIGADGTVTYLVISDGYPNDRHVDIITLASTMQSTVNTIFAGPADDEIGKAFMLALAQAGRGKNSVSVNAQGIGDSIKLLAGGVK